MAYSENKAPLPIASNTPQKEGHIGLTLLQCHLPVAHSPTEPDSSGKLPIIVFRNMMCISLYACVN